MKLQLKMDRFLRFTFCVLMEAFPVFKDVKEFPRS